MWSAFRLTLRTGIQLTRSVVSQHFCQVRSKISYEVMFDHARGISAASAAPPVHKHSSELMSLDEIVSDICGDDEELEKRLRVLMLEVEVMRQDGRRAPEKLSLRHWKNLLDLSSRSQRVNYLIFLFKNEKSNENLKAKKNAKRLEMESMPREISKEHPDDLVYSLQHNAMFLRIRDTSINDLDNFKALQAMMFGQSLVLDCSYDNDMVSREAINAAKQLTMLFGDNRTHRDPFNLHICNADFNGVTMEAFHRNIPTLFEPWFPINIHKECFMDVFPKEKLVYLTPHCNEELTVFDREAVYIVGCMVDKRNNEPLSLAKAKKAGIRMAKLPLDRYLEWAPGSGKSLNINHMISILLDLKLTGDWDHALRHVPRRKLMETKIQHFTNAAGTEHWSAISRWRKASTRKMDGQKALCDNLIEWLQTLELRARHATPADLSDGVAVAEALSQIAPEYFTASWSSKIKTDVGANWRLKVSNLKKILEGVVDYHQDILNLSLQEFARPDVVNIAEHADPVDLGRLLQLVLSCAVNCNHKEEFITRIMELELSLQRSIMQAIQELEDLTLGPSRGSLGAEGAGRAADVDEREVLAQRCHDLEVQLKALIEEKNTLLLENQRLSAGAARRELESEAGGLDEAGGSLGPAHAGTLRYTDMRAQLERIKEQLDKVEQQRDDHAARADALHRDLAVESMRREELQKAASETAALKDEVDALRETAAKAVALEGAVNSYKKRMEEHADLRRQVKILEQSNLEHVQRAIEHEQVAARAQATRAQLDIYKKQVTDLNEKLDAEITKADKLEIENKKMSTKLLSLRRERDSLLQERDALKETCEELKCSTINTGRNEENMSRELIPNDMKERLVHLEHENKLLRQNNGAQADQASVQALLDDYVARLEKQRTLNREANQRIMELEASLEEATEKRAESADKAATTSHDNIQKVAEATAALETERRKVAMLQESLAAREAEILATEDKYKKCVEKAKEVIKTLDPKNTGQPMLELALPYARSGAGGASGAAAGAGGARGEAARATQAEPAPRQGWWEGAGGMREGEERLLTTAWFRLGARCHRDSVEQRFALLSAGQSFLARQRRAPPRKPRTPFKGE